MDNIHAVALTFKPDSYSIYGSFNSYGNYSGGITITLPEWTKTAFFYSARMIASPRLVDESKGEMWDQYAREKFSFSGSPPLSTRLVNPIINHNLRDDTFPYTKVRSTGKIDVPFLHKRKLITHGIAHGWLTLGTVSMTVYLYPSFMQEIESVATGRWTFDRYAYNSDLKRRSSALFFKNELDRTMVTMML